MDSREEAEDAAADGAGGALTRALGLAGSVLMRYVDRL